MKLERALVVILTTVVLDAVGIGLIFPILPELMRQLAHTDQISVLYGVMLAVYAAMQLLFAPVLGVLSDRHGRRPVLLLSLAGATLDYAFMALAPALWMLFLGRAIAGLSSANMAVATAVLADITPEPDRARRFGYIHAGFGVGFVAGPLLGGLLGAWHVRAPFLLASLLCAVNLGMALLLLPETRPRADGPGEARGLSPFAPLRWALGQPALRPLLTLYATLSLVGQTYGTVWVLFCEDRFAGGPQLVGLSLAAYGLFHAGAQAGLAGPAMARLGGRGAVSLGMAFEACAATLLAFATQRWALFALLPLFALSGLSLPALQALLSGAVDSQHQGRLQGVLSGLVSLTAIFGPLLFSGIYAASRGGWNGWVWIVAAAIYAGVSPLLRALPATTRAAPEISRP